MTSPLTPDAKVPGLTVSLVGGGTFDLSTDAPKNFTMVIFYRGYHCPVCKSYLEGLKQHLQGYRDQGFSVVAVSMDGAERAAKTAEEWDVGDLTIGYGLTEAKAREWGLYVSKAIKDAEADIFCEPGLFWVRPDKRLYLADVSNMPWARPDLGFLLSKAPFAIEKGYPARGTKPE